MAWKKVIVSGSDAVLAGLTVDNSIVATDITASLQGAVVGNVTGNLTGTADTASYVSSNGVKFASVGGEQTATQVSASVSARLTTFQSQGVDNALTASFVDGDDVEFLASGNGQTATTFSSSAASRITTLEGTGTIQGVGTTNDVTFADITATNITATGTLTVQGTVTSIETTNLNVDDQFILLNSGSGGVAADAGFVAYDDGPSFGWDNSEGRWAFDATGSTWNQTSIASDAFVAAVKIGATDANYEKAGNLRVDGGEIYIYV
jgi:hypothetical protein